MILSHGAISVFPPRRGSMRIGFSGVLILGVVALMLPGSAAAATLAQFNLPENGLCSVAESFVAEGVIASDWVLTRGDSSCANSPYTLNGLETSATFTFGITMLTG